MQYLSYVDIHDEGYEKNLYTYIHSEKKISRALGFWGKSLINCLSIYLSVCRLASN
jgi:hypothetical protein